MEPRINMDSTCCFARHLTTKLVTIYVTVPYERHQRMNIADAQARH